MPDVTTELDYLKDLDLYNVEKPYWCFLAPHEGFDADTQRVDNLEFEAHSNIKITDVRNTKDDIKLEEYGFQILSHTSEIPSFTSPTDVAAYKEETAQLLKETFSAVYTKCYDLIFRENVVFRRNQFDLNDPLHREGPAHGAHNDVTYQSGPMIIDRYTTREEKHLYLRRGFRVRIINTWRSLLPVLEDRPLALCDFRSVSTSDLIASDRILPDRVGEVYYLKYNPNHKWYWLSQQTPSEPFVLVMYDTKAGNHARFCPHVSFDNPLAPPDAAPRRSVETRSVVITKED